MRRILLGSALLAAIAGLPTRAQDDFKGPELFPTSPFSAWTYKVQGQEEKLVVSIFETKDKNGERIYRYDGRIRNQSVISEYLSIRKDGVYRVRHEGVDIEPPLLICRFPPVKGDTWKAEYKLNDKKVTVDFYCDTEEITHRKKQIRAVVIRAHVLEGENDIINTCWYVPRDGLVKQVIEEGDKQIVIEFEEYRRLGGGGKGKSP